MEVRSKGSSIALGLAIVISTVTFYCLFSVNVWKVNSEEKVPFCDAYSTTDANYSRNVEQQKLKRWILQNLRLNATHRAEVVCMIFTTPDKWDSRGRAVQNTWAKRCPIPIFFYSREAAKPATNNDPHPITRVSNAVALDVPEGRRHLTCKTFAALRYSFEVFGEIANWFLKADDDTYVIWENMQHLLSGRNISARIYLGRLLQNHLRHGYASGGAGYLITKPAVSRMLDAGRKYPEVCNYDGAIEDLDIGRCLEKLEIYLSKTIGDDGKLRMHSDNPQVLLDGSSEHAKWYYFTWENGIHIGNVKMKTTDHIMSRDSVTFHYVTPGQMYMFDFLLYKLRRHQTSTVLHRTASTTKR